MNFWIATYQSHTRRLRDYLFGYIAQLARLGHSFAPIVNPLLTSPRLGKARQALLGLNLEHDLPALSRRSLSSQWGRQQVNSSGEKVLFLSDAFTEFYQPHVGLAALHAIHKAGYHPIILPVIGAGRTLISKGFLEPARRQAKRVIDAIYQIDPTGELAIIGVEPSEIYTLRDEYLDLLSQDERARRIADRAWMIDEWLIRPGIDGQPRILRIAVQGKPNADRLTRQAGKVALHGHCYQKARPPVPDGYPVGAGATRSMLEALGYQVDLIDAGCCGMAGSFGYEVEHADLSKKVAELALLPYLRKNIVKDRSAIFGTFTPADRCCWHLLPQPD